MTNRRRWGTEGAFVYAAPMPPEYEGDDPDPFYPVPAPATPLPPDVLPRIERIEKRLDEIEKMIRQRRRPPKK